MDLLYSIFGLLIFLLPLILIILVIRWIFIIKEKSEEQVKQNKEIIALLKGKK
ncbi:hypothetical protein [Salipaludibacillus aurantiacus]|uniref:DUF4083 domain-containing protein n=1 Tax=Salipaludibacillus aurantiacus TaxID=1601833 RepID=A0A1H9Q8H1_9BACI|nr:hypothetical protein [Salipaludibacillus aurantiacus]SER56801.1 hypothetical protein SAMN05518684_10288 [Salipaludibacillus aurantiacus]